MRYYAHFGHRDFILCLGYRGRRDQGVLPALRGGALERLRAVRRRPPDRAPRLRHPGLADHLRRHRARTPRSASGCSRSATISRARSCSSPTTGTPSPMPRSTASSRMRAERIASRRLLGVRPPYSFHVVRLDDDRKVLASPRYARRTSGSTAAVTSSRRAIFDYLGSWPGSRRRAVPPACRRGPASARSRTTVSGSRSTRSRSSRCSQSWRSGRAPWAVWRTGDGPPP